MSTPIPTLRVRAVNDAPPRARGAHVLYWMTSARRRGHNFALQHAVAVARARGLPLVVLEALRVGYPWASDRLHGFVLDGMHANQQAFAGSGVTYHPYVEPTAGAGAGLVAALAARAHLVVADYFPAFFLPRMLRATAQALDVRVEAVDGNGLLPIAAAPTDFPTAYAFRRLLQRALPAHLWETMRPLPDPLAGPALPEAVLPAVILRRWPAASDALLAREPTALRALPIDHDVGLVALRGGAAAAGDALERFLDERLARYGEGRNHPDDDAASGLSPYLHFGHLSTHDVFARLIDREGWTPARLSRLTNGKRERWWNLSPAAEAFLDELVTWRELGYNHCARNPRTYDRLESLPPWAQRTLAAHAGDPRPHLYSLEQLARAETADAVWNAAQRELVRDGRMHNYLRMLWGKKILEWSPTPAEALHRLVELNNRYALDGRDPSSYSGIFWVLGRYDRPWPERSIFGQVRYMSSRNTVKKLHLKRYLARFSAEAG